MPRDPLHPFGHFATSLWDVRSITIVASCQVCVYARPLDASTTSDSGPSPTTIVPPRPSVGGAPACSLKYSICLWPGSVTQTSVSGSTHRT